MWAMTLALAAARTGQLPAPPAPMSADIEAPGPSGPLKGTILPGAPGRPVVLVIPGSGPTDRDGNNPTGLRAAPYRLLVEGLAARGIGSVRIDKRGMFASAGAVPDPNAVTLADYAADTRAWIAAVRARTGAPCVWLLGHSEGGLVALATAATGSDGICGLVLVAAPGRPFGVIVKEQLAANPANAALLPAANAALDALAAGRRVDPADIPPPLMPLFAPAVQGYLISLLVANPAALVARLTLPVLILQGERDIQVSVADARALARADPRATLRLLPDVNHVLKTVTSDDRRANVATYADPNLPLAPGVVEAVAEFVTAGR